MPETNNPENRKTNNDIKKYLSITKSVLHVVFITGFLIAATSLPAILLKT
jgi:hypothetical protein